ncbi:MAG: PP2C family protein-serine/threonine phosphatase [Ktedonobacteraceae bacterium]
MLPKIRLSYGLPEIEHATISLRAQLRLSYETSPWLRYVALTGLVLLGVILILGPGSFPPHVFVVLWQTLPLASHLLALHGWAAFFSLLALALQALTWVVLWGLYLHLCRMLIRSVWRLYHTQRILESGWLSSTSLQAEKARQGELAPVTLASLASVSDRPTLPSIPALGKGQPELNSVPNALLTYPTAETAQTARQFVQPTAPPTPPRPTVPSSNSSANLSRADWPSLVPTSSPGIAWNVGLTRRGRPNEDSVLTLRGTCNFAERLLPFELHIIADGMGGHAQGRLASHLAIKSMLETVIPGLVASETLESDQIVDVLIDGVHWANQVIYQYGQEQNSNMGTTITAVLLLDELAYIVNVGDSRTYLYRPDAGLTQITRDHSLVARMVEAGEITPDEVYTHPERNMVYRGLGDKTDVTVDWFILPVQMGDLLLLCSDGLWEMVRDPRITEILATHTSAPMQASNALLWAALQAGGKDNVSLLVARVQP